MVAGEGGAGCGVCVFTDGRVVIHQRQIHFGREEARAQAAGALKNARMIDERIWLRFGTRNVECDLWLRLMTSRIFRGSRGSG